MIMLMKKMKSDTDSRQYHRTTPVQKEKSLQSDVFNPVLVPYSNSFLVLQSSQQSVNSVFQDARGVWSQQSICHAIPDVHQVSQCCYLTGQTVYQYTSRQILLPSGGESAWRYKETRGVISPGRRELPPLYPTKPCFEHALLGFNFSLVVFNKYKRIERSSAGPDKYNL